MRTERVAVQIFQTWTKRMKVVVIVRNAEFLADLVGVTAAIVVIIIIIIMDIMVIDLDSIILARLLLTSESGPFLTDPIGLFLNV